MSLLSVKEVLQEELKKIGNIKAAIELAIETLESGGESAPTPAPLFREALSPKDETLDEILYSFRDEGTTADGKQRKRLPISESSLRRDPLKLEPVQWNNMSGVELIYRLYGLTDYTSSYTVDELMDLLTNTYPTVGAMKYSDRQRMRQKILSGHARSAIAQMLFIMTKRSKWNRLTQRYAASFKKRKAMDGDVHAKARQLILNRKASL